MDVNKGLCDYGCVCAPARSNECVFVVGGWMDGGYARDLDRLRVHTLAVEKGRKPQPKDQFDIGSSNADIDTMLHRLPQNGRG